MVTVVPSGALAVMVLPLTLETVSEPHWPSPPGLPLGPAGAVEDANGRVKPDVGWLPAACAVCSSDEPMTAPAPRVSKKASATPPISSHRGMARRGGGCGGYCG